MTELLGKIDLRQGIDTTVSSQPDRTDDQILQALDTLYDTIDTLDAIREASLQSRPPGSVIDPKEFSSLRGYCFTLARIGRQSHRDKHEIQRTSVRLGSIIAALHEEHQPVYAKTRSKTPGGAPEYTLGIILATHAVVVEDYPMDPKLALRIKTSARGHREDLTQVCIDDIAAQLEARGADTGRDTPIVAVGQQAVKGFVEQAYANPRAERSATGIDSCDIFWAMCKSGISLQQLGFTEEDVSTYKSRVIANLSNVCNNGATYMHDVPMLLPLCGSIREALNIIDGTFAENCPHEIPYQLEQERSRLLATYLPAHGIIQNI